MASSNPNRRCKATQAPLLVLFLALSVPTCAADNPNADRNRMRRVNERRRQRRMATEGGVIIDQEEEPPANAVYVGSDAALPLPQPMAWPMIDDPMPQEPTHPNPAYDAARHGDVTANDEPFLVAAYDARAAAAATATNDAPYYNDQDEPPYDPSAYDYLIVHYHKTGHAASLSLANILARNDDTPFPRFTLYPFGKRKHDVDTMCPLYRTEGRNLRGLDSLELGTIHLQEGPDFYCDVESLAELLMRSDDPSKKRGIKIVHMVRNPFDLVVSNYKYHRQDPTPEPWVEKHDVCKAEEDPMWPEEVVTSALGPQGANIFQEGDFTALLDVCHDLYRTRPGLEEGYYYDHLRDLSPEEGLVLSATTQLRGKNADVARMANNVLKFRQLQMLENQVAVQEHRTLSVASQEDRKIQVLTMGMDELSQDPYGAALRFYSFLLPGDLYAPANHDLANKYAQNYGERKGEGPSRKGAWRGGSHISGVDGDMNEMLEGVLREHEVLGRVFGGIEGLVDEALRDR